MANKSGLIVMVICCSYPMIKRKTKKLLKNVQSELGNVQFERMMNMWRKDDTNNGIRRDAHQKPLFGVGEPEPQLKEGNYLFTVTER